MDPNSENIPEIETGVCQKETVQFADMSQQESLGSRSEQLTKNDNSNLQVLTHKEQQTTEGRNNMINNEDRRGCTNSEENMVSEGEERNMVMNEVCNDGSVGYIQPPTSAYPVIYQEEDNALKEEEAAILAAAWDVVGSSTEKLFQEVNIPDTVSSPYFIVGVKVKYINKPF